MRFTKFIIENFKGIKKTELDLNQLGKGNIFTLVGLNESGKTTILEAINSFSPDLSAENIYQSDVFRRVEKKDLVPKHHKDNFTGYVQITAELKFSFHDRLLLRQFFKDKYELIFDDEQLNDTLKVVKYFNFNNSDFEKEGSWWTINLFVKTSRQRNYRELNHEDKEWQGAVSFIRSLIPSVCYFPTFLFEFPSRVYLSETPEQYEPQNEYYKQIIQDVLDSLDRGLTIQEHIVDRVNKIEEGEPWNLFKFFQSDRKEQVDAVMNHLGTKITKSVFTRWNEIFGSEFKKNIKIEWNVDGEEKNPPIYLSFKVQDGVSTYSISERSLGFRWFFCFLLFTQFRKARRESGTLFLLDEPASNLHSTAQQQLLKSFEAVSSDNSNLIYSTHSHYMINPRWLEGVFIVENGGIEQDTELDKMDQYELNVTRIKATPYRRFVGENIDKSTYYQPVLDALDYAPGAIEHQSNTVFVEGKGDFYAFSYFKDVVFKEKKYDIRFLAGTGASGLDPLISLYLGWGFEFLILLDDDFAGKKSRKSYIENWYLHETKVNTLESISTNFTDKKLEDLISEEGKKIIMDELNIESLSKSIIARFFQDCFARDVEIQFDKKTIMNFNQILDYLADQRTPF